VYEKYYNVNDLYISYDKKEFLKPSNIRDISQTPLEKIESIIG